MRELGHRLLPLWGMAEDGLRDPFAHLARQHNVPLSGDEDPILAIYLAASPVWQPPEAVPSVFEPVEPHGAKPGESTPSDPTDAAQDADEPVVADDLESQIVGGYLAADQAQKRGDRGEAVAHLRKVVAVGRILDGLTELPTIGNSALVAERVPERDIALELHKMAVGRDPDHSNIVQNYVSFVVTTGLIEEYEPARRAIQRIIDGGTTTTPFRAKTLLLAIDVAQNGVTDELRSRLLLLRQELITRPSLQDLSYFMTLAPLMRDASSLISSEDVRLACQAVGEAVDTQRDRYTVLTLANRLFAYSSVADENEAVQLYIMLLSTGAACAYGAADDPGFMETNIGHAFRVRGYNRAAASVFIQLYPKRPSSTWLRRNLALLLNTLGHPQAASAALLGQELPEVRIAPEFVPADTFVAPPQWWSNLTFEGNPPCPTTALALIAT
jgi:hypothetical protein